MYFSAKITNSALSFLSKRGLDVERVYACTEIPSEFLRDPSCWLEVEDVESFLSFIEREYCNHFPGENLIELIGHTCAEINAWGALDSVLKMMQKPQDVFVQPQRFISYFVSPPPPIGSLKKDEFHISFELPISTDEFPFVTEYLRSCIEALPSFMNQEMAHVVWSGTKIEVNWTARQVNFFDTNESGHNINPEFMQSLIEALEKSEKELKIRNTEGVEKDKEIQKLQVEIENLRSTTFGLVKSSDIDVTLPPRKRDKLKNRIATLRGEVSRFADYLARAQQLITLLVAQDRKSPQVKEAMRRVDWEKVTKNYPVLLDQTYKHFEKIIEALNSKEDIETFNDNEEKQAKVQLTEVLDNVIKKITKGQSVQVNKLYFYNEELPVFKKDIENLFSNILQSSISSLSSERPASLRIVTRPKGRLAEIEITDTGTGIDTNKFLNSKEGELIESILKRHRGRWNLSSREGSGSTYVVDLPTR
ncbi:MAG: HAMP domain-containing histidine kinase [Bdellovibrionaceae bacterium]|nr:HAMP domain-containing histidine kinase [Pseudobdellovibrionaceae bacterium]